MRTIHIIKVIIASALIAFAVILCMSYIVIVGPADNKVMGIWGGTLFHIVIILLLIAFIIQCISWFFFDNEESVKTGAKHGNIDEIVITYKEDTDDNGNKSIEGEVKLLTKEDATVESRGGGPRSV